MPTSDAALAGIKHNGLRWKHHLHGLIKPETEKLGAFNDRLDGDDDHEQLVVSRAESEPVVEEIIRKVRVWCEKTKSLPEDARRDIESKVDDLECVSDCDMGEINFAMNYLYDEFDYWRICTG
ncbi:hypothetical protein vBCbaSRXM_64 [Citromicrobium phage vB_CbaS-RXM]|nr:hypothetical protein vBCbaSRXM_64 [Citromicrobium phage vB_CbaS-RXM]